MGLKDFFKEAKEEKKVIEGEITKDKTYSSSNSFKDESDAADEFTRSIKKLYKVKEWSELPGLTSKFILYDNTGQKKQAEKPAIKGYIKIILPGPAPENWVTVTDIREEEKMVEFTVSPSIDPTADRGEKDKIKHFFIDEATSTFRVELRGNEIHAWEIGRNEGINNEGREAGERKLINTLIAEGGWAGFQELQWKKLTEYLVHKIELEEKKS